MTKPRFRWNKKDKLNNLAQSLLIYKSEMEFDARLTPYHCKLKYSNIVDCKDSC